MSNTNKDRDIFIDEYMLNRLTETFKALSDYNVTYFRIVI